MKSKYFAHAVKNKYGKFDSIAEFERFLYLKHMQDRGIIAELKTQVKFEIIPKLTKTVKVQLKTKVKNVEKVDEMAAHYTADFTYKDKDGILIIEEVKSEGTKRARDYPLRKKLIKKQIAECNKTNGFEVMRFNEVIAK